MNMQITTRQTPQIVCHFARNKDLEKAGEVLLEWTRDQWRSSDSAVRGGLDDMQKALQLAAGKLKLNQEVSPQTTGVNGLVQRSFETARLVAVPALPGMAGPAVFALSEGQAPKVFTLSNDSLDELKVVSNEKSRDVRAEMGDTIVAVNPKNLDLVVSDYSGGETNRICSYNRPDAKMTFTHMGRDHIQAKIAHDQLYEGTVVSGNERLTFAGGVEGNKLTYQPGPY